MENIKQVLVVRKDLHMRSGKIASQCCHASTKIILDLCTNYCEDGISNYYFNCSVEHPLEKWLTGKFTKICVYCNSEEELLNLYQQAKDENILCSLIEDCGLTEFHGIPTKTCIAIGPDFSEKIDKITGHLKLL